MKPLSCEHARRLLGASRRDDWTADELTALGAHLTSCAECRKVEARYREVGDHVRQLPSTPPPAWFRERVFAAITVEAERIVQQAARQRMRFVPRIASSRAGHPAAAVSAVSQVAGAETDPSLAAVWTPRRPQPLPLRVAIGVRANMRIVAALAAMLLLALLGATLVPASPFSLIHPLGSQPSLAHYAADARVSRLATAGASTAWVAYSGQDAGGQHLLLAQSRQGAKSIELVNGAASPIAVEAVSGHWVLWRATDGADWRLTASLLPSGQTMTLLDSASSGPGAPAALHGVWAAGNRVLAAITTRDGSGLVMQFDLSSGVPAANVVARAGPSFALASPSFDGSKYYWATILQDPTGGLHSSIWRGADASHAQQIDSDDKAFHPLVTHGMLMWVSATSLPKTSGSEIDQGLAAAIGTVQERNLGSGDQRRIGTNASAASLAAAGALVLWQSGGKTYTYDLGAQGPSRVDGLLRDASVVGLSDTALVWAQPGSTTLSVYNLQ